MAVAAADTMTVAVEGTGVWPAEGEATPAAPASQLTITEAVANSPTAPAAAPTAAAGPGAGVATSRQRDFGNIQVPLKKCNVPISLCVLDTVTCNMTVSFLVFFILCLYDKKKYIRSSLVRVDSNPLLTYVFM